MRIFAALALCALLGSGCSTVKTCDIGGRKMVSISNTGWFLLSAIPVASGNPMSPNSFSCRMFTNTVNVESNMRMLDRVVAADEESDSVKNVISNTSDESVLFFLVKRRVCNTSAELYKAVEEPAQ